MKKYFEKKHPLLIISYLIFYLLAFRLLEMRGNGGIHIIHTSLDDRIPFCEYFIIRYVLWFFYVAATVIYFSCFEKNTREYWQFMASLGVGMTLFLLVSWLYPNGHDLRPALTADGNIFTEMVRILYQIDTPTNILPSIHVFNSLAAAAAIGGCESLRKHRILCLASWFLALTIVLSTMFLKQHSVFDVLCGIALYGAVYLAVYAGKTDYSIRLPQRQQNRLQKNI